jgi:hypothetical protein
MLAHPPTMILTDFAARGNCNQLRLLSPDRPFETRVDAGGFLLSGFVDL